MPSRAQPPQAARKPLRWLRVKGGLAWTEFATVDVGCILICLGSVYRSRLWGGRLVRSPPSWPVSWRDQEIALGSARIDGIAQREVSDGLARLGEGARHVAGAVDPEDDERGCADIVKAMRFAGGYVGGVVLGQAGGLAVDLDFPVAFKERHLLAAVVAVHRRASARRERGEA